MDKQQYSIFVKKLKITITFITDHISEVLIYVLKSALLWGYFFRFSVIISSQGG